MELTTDTQTETKKLPNKNQIGQYLHIRKELAKKLYDMANKDPALNAICSLFALRERSRKQITLRNLILVMDAEGFKFTKTDYERSFRFLADLGVGILDIDLKGNLRSLKDIRFSLQNLGFAALGKMAANPINPFPIKQTRKPYLTEVSTDIEPERTVIVEEERPKEIEELDPNVKVDIKIRLLGRDIWIKKTHKDAAEFLMVLIEEMNSGKS